MENPINFLKPSLLADQYLQGQESKDYLCVAGKMLKCGNKKYDFMMVYSCNTQAVSQGQCDKVWS